MSSLKSQLSALSRNVPRPVASMRHKAQRRVTILFSESEVEQLDVGKIHSIGVNGLLALKRLDSRFGAFESTLFAAASTELDRELQTEEVNAKLDQSLEQFLLLLSPFVLLKPAQKAFEYLLRRYRYVSEMLRAYAGS